MVIPMILKYLVSFTTNKSLSITSWSMVSNAKERARGIGTTQSAFGTTFIISWTIGIIPFTI